ncbi:TonB-dependent receptor [Ascidiimonas aurantiaca]|uniref:TonB-dependent receptor n=1 Tax=Ascidiimonas aurantiaca TaxID=1685432 RepID=UPI0030EE4C43
MKHLLGFLTLLLSITTFFAQETGSIVGKITDKELNNDPLPFANVLVKGTSKGTTTDFDGLFQIEDVEPGTYTIVVSFIGYKTIEVANVTVAAGKVTEITAGLSQDAQSLDEVVVTTVARRDSEVALLLQQKNAVEMKQSIGAAELSRKGIGDAQAAVTKVTGVSKQEGVKNVFVRGLGDRYNSTSYNGLPLPSEDPEYKNIALDFFSSDIIQSVGINKTFGTGLYGDVGGANIDIASKELFGDEEFQISIGSGVNTRAVGVDFLTVDGANWFGTGLSKDVPITDPNLTSYSFENSYGPNQQNLQLNNNIAVRYGKRFKLGKNTLNTYIIGALDSKFMYQEGNTKAVGVLNTEGEAGTDLDFDKYIYNVSQMAMGNFKFIMPETGTINLNTVYIHSNVQRVEEYIGEDVVSIAEQDNDLGFIRRQQVNDNNLWINQLRSNFSLSDKLDLDANLAYNMTRSNEPDRRQNTVKIIDGEPTIANDASAFNHRFFSVLEEDDLVGHLKFSYKLGDKDTPKGNLEGGYNYRFTDRRFDFTQFNHRFSSPNVSIDLDNPDALFNQESLDQGIFELETNRGFANQPNQPSLLDPFFYEADRTIHAFFVNSQYNLSDNLTVGVGLRIENIEQFVNWDTNISSSDRDPTLDPSELSETYFLPNLDVKYNFNENSIFRFSGSRTYTFPQFKELAPFLYEEVNFSSFGNPDLQPSDNYNFDLKYEYYFSAGELISFGGFYKRIDNPINRISVNSASNQLSYINSGETADIAGIEIEFRKDIWKSTNSENLESTSFNEKKLSFGLNASYLHSRQELTDESTNFTNTEDELEGAAPLLVNSDITYFIKNRKFNLTSSLVFNYFADRIFSLGVQGQENIVETGIPTLDLVLRSKLGDNFGINLGVQNILDPTYELTQTTITGENVSINSFKKGIVMSLGFSYGF